MLDPMKWRHMGPAGLHGETFARLDGGANVTLIKRGGLWVARVSQMEPVPGFGDGADADPERAVALALANIGRD